MSIPIRDAPDTEDTSIDVWVDTGFTGDLVLPKSQIEQLGLQQSSVIQTMMADGRKSAMESYVAWLDWFGKTSSAVSRTRKPVLPASLSTEKIERLRKLYRSFAADQIKQGYDYVVMGHCHDLDEMCFHVDGRPGQYINVGYPRVHGSFLSWNSGDEKIQREALP